MDKDVNWSNIGQVQNIYNKHWEYDRSDKHLQNLLSNPSMYSQADDHEVINNYGNWSYWNNVTKDRPDFKNLINSGIHSFSDFSPIDKNNTVQFPDIYRHFNWGKDVDLFILDAHSYRDRNDLPQNLNTENKTLFGPDQIKWLEQGLLKSDSTWKIISDDNPVFIPECQNDGIHAPFGCDNWATDGNTTMNFSNERNQFLKFLDDNNIKNVIFITTDVHFPANILLDQDFNNDGKKLVLYELISGPLSAGASDKGEALDPTVNATYLYNEGKLFNFGYYKIQKNPVDGKAYLIAEVRGIDGLTRPDSFLDITPK